MERKIKRKRRLSMFMAVVMVLSIALTSLASFPSSVFANPNPETRGQVKMDTLPMDNIEFAQVRSDGVEILEYNKSGQGNFSPDIVTYLDPYTFEENYGYCVNPKRGGVGDGNSALNYDIEKVLDGTCPVNGGQGSESGATTDPLVAAQLTYILKNSFPVVEPAVNFGGKLPPKLKL